MSLRICLVVAVLSSVLSACGGTEDEAPEKSAEPRLVLPEAGQCVAREVIDQGDGTPDLTSVVPCTEPHLYEVTGVVPVPKRLLDESSEKASLARRNAFARVSDDPKGWDSQLVRAIDCDKAMRETTGIADIPLPRREAREAIRPVVANMLAWRNVAPAELWAKGEKVVICSYRFGAEKPTLHRSPDQEPLLSHLLTPAFPVELRECVGDDEDNGSCAYPHGFETLLDLDLDKLLGDRRDTLNRGELLVVTDAICDALWSAVGGPVRGLDTFPFPSDDERTASCMVSPKEKGADLPPGYHAFGPA